MKTIIGVASFLLFFCHQPSGATLVSIDYNFKNYDFSVFAGGSGAGDVTFRISYDSNAPDAHSDPKIGSYTGTETLITGGKTSSTVPATIQVFSNGSGDGGSDEVSVVPLANF